MSDATAEGVIRRARRPTGWTAPGPTPPPLGTAAEGLPRAGEDLCYLVGDWRILQRVRGHRWSLDDLVTAWVAQSAVDEPPSRILDLGTGIGSVALMLGWRFAGAHVTGVEAQGARLALARRSCAVNGATDRYQWIEGDLRDARLDGTFPLVTGTPPYFPPGTVSEARDALAHPCRVEVRGGVEAYVAAMDRHLSEAGAAVLCMAMDGLGRVERAAASHGLRVHDRLDVIPSTGKPPLFFVATLRRSEGIQMATRTITVRHQGQWTTAFLGLREAMGLPPRPLTPRG